MPQSLASLHLHLIFSTKNREEFIHDGNRQALHAYMAGILKNADCEPRLINSMPDHVHILFELARTLSVCQAVEKVKASSSKWMKIQAPQFESFSWQKGYAVFAVSESIARPSSIHSRPTKASFAAVVSGRIPSIS